MVLKHHYSRIFALLALILPLSTSFAKASSYDVILKTGFSHSKLYGTGNDQADSSPATKMIAGISISRKINDHFSLQFEMNYNRTGLTRKYSIYYINREIKIDENIQINYLDFPLLAKLPFPSDGGRVVSLLVGPSTSIKLASSANGSNQIDNSQILYDPYDEPISNIRNLDFGFTIGIELINPIKNINFLIGSRYRMGLREVGIDSPNIFNLEAGNVVLLDSEQISAKGFKNGYFSIELGVVF